MDKKTENRKLLNKIEKYRRAELKEYFEILKNQLHQAHVKKKSSKRDILNLAVGCIQSLKHKEKNLKHEMAKLKRENKSAQAKLAALQNQTQPVSRTRRVHVFSDSVHIMKPLKIDESKVEIKRTLEKRRRFGIAESFDLLKKQLPRAHDGSTLGVICSALLCIQSLKCKERELEDEMERLTRDQKSAQQRLAALKQAQARQQQVSNGVKRPRRVHVFGNSFHIVKPPKTDESKAEVKRTKEKRRRFEIADCFDMLKKLLPQTKNDSTLSVLRSGIRCIESLKRKEQALEYQKYKLARDNKSAEIRLAVLNKYIKAYHDNVDSSKILSEEVPVTIIHTDDFIWISDDDQNEEKETIQIPMLPDKIQNTTEVEFIEEVAQQPVQTTAISVWPMGYSISQDSTLTSLTLLTDDEVMSFTMLREERFFDCANPVEPWKCSQCANFQTEKLAHLKQHLKSGHAPLEFQEEIHQCESCDFQSSSHYLFLRHVLFELCLKEGKVQSKAVCLEELKKMQFRQKNNVKNADT